MSEETQRKLDEALNMVQLDVNLDPDENMLDPGDTWEALVNPSCTALAPHGSIGSVRLSSGHLDQYGLPDFDDMDFDGELMPIADKVTPLKRKASGIVFGAVAKMDSLCGIVCT